MNFFERKKYEEKKVLNPKEKSSTTEANNISSDSSSNNVSNSEKNVSQKEKAPEVCPICGKELTEEQKNNFLTDEEYEKRKEEDSKKPYSPIMNAYEETLPEHQKAGERIKIAVSKEFNLEPQELFGYKQAHHILSRNDIFFKDKEFAKLAMSAGYDINCVENGIVLPTKLQIPNWKEEDKYKVMRCTGMQYHCGQHSYTIYMSNQVSEDDRKIFPKKNYSQLVTEKYEELSKKYISKSTLEKIKNKVLCRCSLTDEMKRQIVEDLYKFSQEIREDLAKFKTEPKSCQYYISAACIEHAFNISENSYEIIEIENLEQSRIEATRCIIIKNLKTNKVYFKRDTKNFRGQSKNFIKFCKETKLYFYKDKLYYCNDEISFEGNPNYIEIKLIENNATVSRIEEFLYKMEKFSVSEVLSSVRTTIAKRLNALNKLK